MVLAPEELKRFTWTGSKQKRTLFGSVFYVPFFSGLRWQRRIQGPCAKSCLVKVAEVSPVPANTLAEVCLAWLNQWSIIFHTYAFEKANNPQPLRCTSAI